MFADELKTLCKKHGICLQGTMRIRKADDDIEEFTLETPDMMMYGTIPDRTGPFLVAHTTLKPPVAVQIKPDRSIHVMSDIKGYDCPVTGKLIDGRREHRENLKRHNCRLLEPGEKRDAMKRREESLNAAIDKCAHEAVMHIANNVEV